MIESMILALPLIRWRKAADKVSASHADALVPHVAPESTRRAHASRTDTCQ